MYCSWLRIGSFEIGWTIWHRTKEFRGNGFRDGLSTVLASAHSTPGHESPGGNRLLINELLPKADGNSIDSRSRIPRVRASQLPRD